MCHIQEVKGKEKGDMGDGEKGRKEREERRKEMNEVWRRARSKGGRKVDREQRETEKR